VTATSPIRRGHRWPPCTVTAAGLSTLDCLARPATMWRRRARWSPGRVPARAAGRRRTGWLVPD